MHPSFRPDSCESLLSSHTPDVPNIGQKRVPGEICAVIPQFYSAIARLCLPARIREEFFDRKLANLAQAPDTVRLENLAMRAMNDEWKRPKLSILQAGLLLLQRKDSSHNDTLPAKLLSLAHTLGIHVDCSDWAIPEWEKSLRKRLAWALYMQDK
jgi:hypothetical protein